MARTGPAPRLDRSWGEPPRLVVLYALGVCAMDTGIRARRLVDDIERVRKDGRVRAVVLRVDSPGGGVLASDLVAGAVRRLKEEKPVIVSQGAVAASGGYWISMYADSIVAAPVTLTGSVGVIFGWFYNRGLKEKLGLSTDRVQAGARADLPFGMELPLLGTLPDRNLREEERAIVSTAMGATYDRFVREVAASRGMSTEAVEAVAGGRIWSGSQAVEAGLVDELGGLMTALRLARERAGLEPGPARGHRRAPAARADRLGAARPEADRPGAADQRLPGLRETAAVPPGAQRAAAAARSGAHHLVVPAGGTARGMKGGACPQFIGGTNV